MVSVGVNYHPTRHTSTIRLVDYVFCYLFPDDLVNFLPRFYAFTKRDKIAIKMGGNFKCCFNYFWIGVRSDFDRFWPTFTWIYKTESSVGVVVRRTRKKNNKTRRDDRRKRKKEIKYSVSRQQGRTGIPRVRPVDETSSRAREPVGNEVTKSTSYSLIITGSLIPLLGHNCCARQSR